MCLGEGGTEGGKVGSFTEGTTCCNVYLTLNELFNSKIILHMGNFKEILSLILTVMMIGERMKNGLKV